MNELKTSIKRIYTRFMVLTAVVVFGAIAIAQAQKEQPKQEFDGASLPPVNAQPIPQGDGLAEGSGDIQLVSNNVDLPSPQDSTVDDTWDVVESEPAASPAESAPEYQLAGYDEPASGDLRPTQTTDSLPDLPRSNPYRQNRGSSDLPPLDQPDLPASDAGDLQAPPLLEESSLPPANNQDYGRADFGDLPPTDGGSYQDNLPALPDADYSQPTADANNFDGDYGQDAAASQSLPPTDSGFDSPPVDQDLPPASYSAPAADVNLPTQQPATQQPTVDHYQTNVSAPYDAGAQAQSRNRGPQAPARTGAEFEHREQLQHSVPRMSVASRSSLSLGKPGPQTMEGPQTPSLTVHKTAPAEIQVGQTAKFEIRVRNVGRVPADNVIIRDVVPAGTEFVDATPKATQAPDGSIYWEAGSLPPGQEISVALQLRPVTEGLVGSVATVSFETSASARTRSTKPDLVVEHTGPLKVLVGDAVRFAIKLSNPGTGAAQHVVLEEDVPVGLSHSSGAKLEYEVGTIQPGQTRHLELTLKAAEAGRVTNTLVARADGGLQAQDVTELEVVAPKLQVAIDGPNTRYLDRQATFTVTVANPGSAPARNVELIAKLPRGLKFVSTNNSGYYDQARNAVIWSLEQLPAGEMGRAQFTALPIEIGAYQIRAEGKADMSLQAQQEHSLNIQGIAALLYTLTDKVDPIEVGGQTTYELKVMNQGSKDATNVQFTALVPEGMRPLSGQGPTAEVIRGQQIQFAPIDRLPPKGQAVFRILVQGQTPGDHRMRVQMTSDDMQTPVIKEESTKIYAD